MSEVACWTCQNLTRAVREAGLPVEDLFRGLAVSIDDIGQRSRRLSWNEYTIIVERTAEMLGGVESLEEVFSRFGVDAPFGWIRILAGSLISSRPLYALGAKWLGPFAFLSTRATINELPDGRLVQSIEILPDYRDCPPFFHGMRGVLRATPGLVGQRDAEVELTIEPRRGIFTITPPPRNRWRLGRQRTLSTPITGALTDFSGANHLLPNNLSEARESEEPLVAQTHPMETVNRLSRELAGHTDLENLADSLIRFLHSQYHFEAIRLLVALRIGGDLEAVGQSGAQDGEPLAVHILRTSTGVVGRIDLWGSPEGQPGDADMPIADLVPWFALALDNVRSFDALNEQRERLESETSERRMAERQLAQAMRMDAIGHLAGGLAHDFNNVLTAVMGHAELASMELQPEHRAQREIEEILAVSERATGLISQVLSYSRHQVLNTQRIDLNVLLQGIESMLRRIVGENIILVTLPGAELGAVVADPGRLEQMAMRAPVSACRRSTERCAISTAQWKSTANPEREPRLRSSSRARRAWLTGINRPVSAIRVAEPRHC